MSSRKACSPAAENPKIQDAQESLESWTSINSRDLHQYPTHDSFDTQKEAKKICRWLTGTPLHLLMALFAQTLWGCYPGFFRFLQTDSGLTALQVLVLLGFVDAVLLAVPLVFKVGWRALIKIKKLWLFTILVLGLNVNSVFATRFTQSVYVQLILLSIPFMVSLMNKIVLKEDLPKYTIPAITFSMIGAFLMLFGEILDNSDELDLTPDDWFGFLFAIGTALSTAAFWIYVRFVREYSSSWALLWMQFPVTFICAAPLSFGLQEDWTFFSRFKLVDYAVLAGLLIGCYVIANFTQIYVIKRLGAPLVSALLPWRLVTAVALGTSPLLNETLSMLQLIGGSVVIISITAYLLVQYRLSMERENFGKHQLLRSAVSDSE